MSEDMLKTELVKYETNRIAKPDIDKNTLHQSLSNSKNKWKNYKIEKIEDPETIKKLLDDSQERMSKILENTPAKPNYDENAHNVWKAAKEKFGKENNIKWVAQQPEKVVHQPKGKMLINPDEQINRTIINNNPINRNKNQFK